MTKKISKYIQTTPNSLFIVIWVSFCLFDVHFDIISLVL